MLGMGAQIGAGLEMGVVELGIEPMRLKIVFTNTAGTVAGNRPRVDST